ncbi:unnamed protein product [Mycena citricolor]|uniref:Alpha/beta-hydrolase n=1 Tax=Mycena citricolor TaxID=2018698 RepID=A0AAD2HIN2_9AGAR|nr:unnamed protein product [Mycena citricolor]
MGVDVSEVLDASRPRQLSYYLVTLLIAPFRLVPPLSWAYVAYRIHTGSVQSLEWKGRLLFAVCVSEVSVLSFPLRAFANPLQVLFSIYHYYLYCFISAPWKHGSGNISQLQIAFERVLKAGLASVDGGSIRRPGSPAEPITQLESDDPRAIDFRDSLRTWFGRVPWSHVRKLQVQQWVYWSIFNKDLPPEREMPAAHRAVLDDTLQLLEMRLGMKIPDGSNPAASPMRLTIDRVEVCGRPFFFYVIVGLINRYLSFWYGRYWKLRRGNYNGLEYLLYVPEGWTVDAGPSPIVFLHGLGLGLLQYYPMTKKLYRGFSDRPLLIPIQPHISQDIFHPQYLNPLCRQDFADLLAGLVDALGWVDRDPDDLCKEASPTTGVTMLSHSNGSYPHAWCLKQHPEIVSRSCFVDPVVFGSWEGDVCYRFLYRSATTGFELFIRYFVGTELGVSNLLRRNFDWSSNSLWAEEIQVSMNPLQPSSYWEERMPSSMPRSDLGVIIRCVCSDQILQRVEKYLTSHGVKEGLWHDPEGQHGQALLTGSPGLKRIMQWLQDEPVRSRRGDSSLTFIP